MWGIVTVVHKFVLYVGTPENSMDFPHNGEIQGACENIVHKSKFILQYVGGPKRNRKRSLVGGPVIVHASAARCLLRGPFCISLPTGIVE
jgi:hypothetical protein